MMIVVMGVSGAGKSVVGQALATRLAVPFCEGDALHPAANVARMAAGQPLTDADRAPWLDAVAGWITAHPAGVVACSALRRRYRDRLRAARGDLRFVLLDVPAAVLAERLRGRAGHFMPATLLASQLDTLERPDPDEAALVVDGTAPLADVLARIDAQL